MNNWSKENLKGAAVTVVGLARTGVGVIRYLAAAGAKITVTDLRDRQALAPFLAQVGQIEVDYRLGSHPEEIFLKADLIVLSPGAPPEIAQVQQAEAHGIPVIGEMELTFANLSAPLLAITGTNGKSTTVSLTGDMVRAAGHRVFVGGNIGNPLVDCLLSGESYDFIVAEVSSFQLERVVKFKPRVAAILNLAPDHLDRYPRYEDYISAKEMIFKNKDNNSVAVLNAGDARLVKTGARLAPPVCWFNASGPVDFGCWSDQGKIHYSFPGSGQGQFDLTEIPLPGVHNLENVMAALGTVGAAGCAVEKAWPAVRSFKGLDHRMELVAKVNGVTFINDSKATNVDAVVRALEGFDGGIILILGGHDKGGDFSPLISPIKDKVRLLILDGEAGPMLHSVFAGQVKTSLTANLSQAVKAAFAEADAGETVLLSPGCASFDQFQSFEHRGDVFKKLVYELS
ncbi:MAG: UDP-N-acetylmuramoyl-L-alanine--D-glutamate ligase [Deltaproteobacteria bacterium]|nr:UDP-N-acetylmuramoyl-L-alanine--D-glutamate ligase [Deltaproteobacteria bacterium]